MYLCQMMMHDLLPKRDYRPSRRSRRRGRAAEHSDRRVRQKIDKRDFDGAQESLRPLDDLPGKPQFDLTINSANGCFAVTTRSCSGGSIRYFRPRNR